MSLLSQLAISVDDFTTQHPHYLYLLTHCHADHINGLKSGWGNQSMPIYCSSVTRYLLNQSFPSLRCQVLPLNEPKITNHPRYSVSQLDDPNDSKINQSFDPSKHVRLTLFDSNHCPGSVMILIEHQSKTILHTGDVRFDPVKFHSSILHQSVNQSIDLMILDATFGHPKYAHFPSKLESARVCVQLIQHYLSKFRINQSNTRSINQSTNQSANQSANQPVNQSVNMCSHCVSHDLGPQIYLACDCLGIEELLTNVCQTTGLKLCFERPISQSNHKSNNQLANQSIIQPVKPVINQSMRLRMKQLRAMNDVRPHVAGPNHQSVNQSINQSVKFIYACSGRGFTRFAEQDQIERKKRYEQMRQSTYQSTNQAINQSTNQPISQSTNHGTCSCSYLPALYIKPSTLYFARHHVRNIQSVNQPNQSGNQLNKCKRTHSMFASGAFLDPAINQSTNHLYDNDTYDEESDFPSQSLNQSINPSIISNYQIDRWGVSHILYSMHSSFTEIVRLIDFIQPKCVTLHSMPVVYDGINKQSINQSNGDDDDNSRVRKLLEDHHTINQFQSMIDAALVNRTRRVIIQSINHWSEDEIKETNNVSNNRSINQSVNQSINQSNNQPQVKPFNRSQSEQSNQSINQPMKQTDRSSTVLDAYYSRRNINNQSISQSINQSNQSSAAQFHKKRVHLFDFTSINQSVNQSNTSINQSINQSKILLAKNIRGDVKVSISQSVNQLKATLCDCLCMDVRLILIDSTKRSCSILIDRLMRKIVYLKHEQQRQYGLNQPINQSISQFVHIYDVRCIDVLMESLTLYLGGLTVNTTRDEIIQAIIHLYEDQAFQTEIHSHFVWASCSFGPAKIEKILEEKKERDRKRKNIMVD